VKVLLVGLRPDRMEEFRRRLSMPQVEVDGVTTVEQVRAACAGTDVAHVVLGGGLSLEARLQMVRAVFESSDRATLHLKDHFSGPEGFVPFVRAVLDGLKSYRPSASASAVLQAQEATERTVDD
jgi:hypothetical protein